MADIETNKIIQLRDPVTGRPVSPVVNVGSLYDKNGNKVDNLVSYKVAGTTQTIPEVKDLTEEFDQKATELSEELESVKTSVSEGKALVAAAVTDKGVETAANATFTDIRDNIIKISQLPDGVTVETGKFSVSTGATNTASRTWSATNYKKLNKFPLYIITKNARCSCELKSYPNISVGIYNNSGTPYISVMPQSMGSVSIQKISNDGITAEFSGEYEIYYSNDSSPLLYNNALMNWNSVTVEF